MKDPRDEATEFMLLDDSVRLWLEVGDRNPELIKNIVMLRLYLGRALDRERYKDTAIEQIRNVLANSDNGSLVVVRIQSALDELDAGT